MNAQVHKVFLSSTNADLARFRDAAFAAIEASDHLKCVDYRNWGPQASNAHQLCRDRVLDAGLFVGLIGPYRGWEITGDNRQRSITELEFDWATEAGKPRFVCVTPDDFAIPAGIRDSDEVFSRQQQFRDRIMADGANVVSRDFSSPDRLATIVINSLLGYLLAEEMRRKASANDPNVVADERGSVRDALRQLADDHDADLDELLDNPADVDSEDLEGRLYARAQAMLQAQTAAQQRAAAYYRHIGALVLLRDTVKAIEAYEEATRLDPDNAEGWRQLGVCHIRRGDYSDARAALERVQALAAQSGDKILEGRTAGNLGAIDYFQGRYAEAERLFSIDHRISQELANNRGIARASGNLGLIYTELKRFDEAEFMHREALEMARRLGNREEVARQTGDLGEVKVAIRAFEEALSLHTEALELDQEIDNREGMARHNGNLGEVLVHLDRHPEAEIRFKRALELDKALGNRAGQARHLRNLARLELADGSHDADALYEQSLKLYEIVQRRADAAETAAELAELKVSLGETETAVTLFEKAMRYAAAPGRNLPSGDWQSRLDELRKSMP